jgi:hypothetical protein
MNEQILKDTVFRIISPNVGYLLSSDDRICMTLATKCFKSAHENHKYQLWTIVMGEYPNLDQKFNMLIKKKPKLKCLDIIFSIPVESDKLYELYKFVEKHENKLEIVILISNNIKSFCKLLSNYEIKKDIIKKYFGLVSDDIEMLKELGLALQDNNQYLNYLSITGTLPILNIVREFRSYLNELRIDIQPFNHLINKSIIDDLKCIPKITLYGYNFLTLNQLFTIATTVNGRMSENAIVFFKVQEKYNRLKLLILIDFHSTQLLKISEFCTLFITNLPKNITIEFQKKSLLDPGIISISKLLLQKRTDIEIKLSIYNQYLETICGLLANINLKHLKNYNFDDTNSILSRWNFTHKELLSQLQESDLNLYMLWSQIKYPS